MLQIENIPSESIITFFRFIRENKRGIVGPAIATISANPLTNRPASGIDTSNSSETYGITPTMPISVLRIPKTPIVRIKTSVLLLIFFTSFIPYGQAAKIR